MMMKHPHYVLDADVLITANRSYYAPDICPSFWQHLIQAHQEGYLISIDRIRDEILDGNDNLLEWVKEEAVDMFASSTELSVANLYAQISDWGFSRIVSSPMRQKWNSQAQPMAGSWLTPA